MNVIYFVIALHVCKVLLDCFVFFLFFSFFLFFQIWVISAVLSSNSLILSSLPYIMLLNSSIEFSYFGYCILNSKVSIWFLCFLILCWTLFSFFFFIWLSMFITAHWSIFMMVVLKFLSDNSNISVISVFVSIDFFSFS